jgi:hypothetical protein
MKPGQPGKYRGSRQNRDLMHFLLQIATPAVAVNFLVFARADAALSLFGIPFCDWASIVCAIWALLVVHHGPFLIFENDNSVEEKKYVAERNAGSTEPCDQGHFSLPRI